MPWCILLFIIAISHNIIFRIYVKTTCEVHYLSDSRYLLLPPPCIYSFHILPFLHWYGFLPFLFFIVVTIELWTISLAVPIFMIGIEFNLGHILLIFLRTKLPKIPFSSRNGIKWLSLHAWSYIYFFLQCYFFYFSQWPYFIEWSSFYLPIIAWCEVGSFLW